MDQRAERREVTAVRRPDRPDACGVELGVAAADLLQCTQLIGHRDGQRIACDRALPVAIAIERAAAVGAPVTVTVFSDFECPFCRAAQQGLRELRALYPKELK